MLIVLSPAKTLDFDSPPTTRVHSQPEWLDESATLVASLRAFDVRALGELMAVSEDLAELNVRRFQSWSPPFDRRNARQAVLAFAGDVYDGLAARSLSVDDLRWAQRHLRILSGLYGVLRPLDLIQPYRLEMGTRLANPRGDDLYAFWGERPARALAQALQGHRRRVVVNLASVEYFRAVRTSLLRCPVIQPVFEERRDGQYKVISFSAKRARGMMARHAITQRLSRPEDLKAFSQDGYRFDAAASDDTTWRFRRDAP